MEGGYLHAFLMSPDPPIFISFNLRRRNLSSISLLLHFTKPQFPIIPLSLFHSTISQNETPHQLFDPIPKRVPPPSDPYIAFIIRSIRSLGSSGLNRGIHALVLKSGFESEIAITTSLIGFYSSVNESGNARSLFRWSERKDLILWSSLVSAFCKNGHFVEAIDTFGAMRCSDISPNSVSLLSVLTACANTKSLRHGKQIHGFALAKGYLYETSIQNSLVDMYVKCGELHDAISVFHGIKEKDSVSWKNIVLGFIENGMLRKALRLYSNMRASDAEADELIIRNVIGICPQVGELKFGLALHCYVIKIGFFDAATIITSLLKMYGDSKDIETAETLFNQLKYKDNVAWSAMISSYSHSGHPYLALDLFKQMKLAKKDANEFTLASLLQACSLIESQKLGKSIHAHALRLGYNSNDFINSALIDLYCKIGRLEQGEALFSNLRSKDLVCWSSMINGYGTHGYAEKAIDTFTNMLDEGLKPNEVVLVSVLSTCMHCCLVEEGLKLFCSMEEKFGVSPNVVHYSCMIVLLGRNGELKKAMELIEKMPFEPDVGIWVSLLSWCRATSDDIEIAEFVVKQIMRFEMKDTSYFVTLANLYSKLGRWEDAEKIRGLMLLNGLRKIAGYSVI